MSFEIVTIPCLSDNYAYLLINDGVAALIDVPEAGPILSAIRKADVTVGDILITHHHADHIDGLSAVIDGLETRPRVVGSKTDLHRLPPLDIAVSDGDRIPLSNGAKALVIDVSGHTVGHIAFYMPKANAAFTADSLMALGCGRVFEGTMEQMWESLSKLAALPRETLICSGHEYTQSNGRFALTIEPDNPALQARVSDVDAARARSEATVPSTLAEELDTNPFLRAGLAEVKANLNMSGEPDVDVFTEIRHRKDSF